MVNIIGTAILLHFDKVGPPLQPVARRAAAKQQGAWLLWTAGMGWPATVIPATPAPVSRSSP